MQVDQRALHVERDLSLREATDRWPGHRVAVVRWSGPEGQTLRALALKMRRADAQPLAGRLAGLSGLSLTPLEAGVGVRAWAGPRDLGLITRLDAVDAELEALVVMQGGARRAHFWPHEVLAGFLVSIRLPQGAGNAAALCGPPSDTLLRFAAPLRPQHMPQPMAAEVLRMASTVWTGVVLSDHEGQPELLEQARTDVCRRGAPSALVDVLVERKRASFGGDQRIFWVEDVQRTHDGAIRVRVGASSL